MALTQSQIKKIRKELERLRGEVVEEIRSELDDRENEQISELLGRTPPDSGDFSFADALADLNVEIVDRHVHELRDIEAAWQRVEAGRYSICIECGVDTDFDRLMAYPTAERCLPCQQRHDKQYVHGRTPSL